MNMILLAKLIKKFQVKRPNSGTWEEWEEWEIKAKANEPVRYFLFDTLPAVVRGFKNRRISPIFDWFRYRIKDRFHIISPKTLNPGYHTSHDRILHAMFNELVSYVEVSLGYRGWLYNSKKKYRKTKANYKMFGLQHLEWEINDTTVPPHQKQKAREIKALYLWWTEVRPKRLDHDTEKLDHIRPHFDKTISVGSMFRTMNNMASSTAQFYDCINAMDEFYHEQDIEMLNALLKILDYLD